MWLRCYASDHVASRLTTHRKWEAGLGARLTGLRRNHTEHNADPPLNLNY
jgi:hypothetical protein